MSMSHLYGAEDGVELERFEVSEWDLHNEFNPHRARHRPSKEEATYGVWAERDSDEERPSFGGKRYGGGGAMRGVPGHGGRPRGSPGPVPFAERPPRGPGAAPGITRPP